MAKSVINVGTAANDGTGDNLRAGAAKINANSEELYNALGDGTNLKDIINSNAIFDYSNNFLEEASSELLEYKNSKDFETQIRVFLGKSFSDSEISELIKRDDKSFKEEINKKFLEKRSERIDIIGEDQSTEIEKRILLQSIDVNWKLHIQYLEQLRQVIGLRSYGQKDPLSEFKKEAFVLFEGLLLKIKNDLIKFLLNLTASVGHHQALTYL